MSTPVNNHLRARFLQGNVGDVTLQFTVKEEVVVERKADSFALDSVAYFTRQTQFAEGHNKKYTIAIDQFYPESARDQLDAQTFVQECLIALYDGDIELSKDMQGCFPLEARYGLVQFREYFDLPYGGVIKSPLPRYANSAARNAAKQHFLTMIKTSCPEVSRMVVDNHLDLYRNDNNFTNFHDVWGEACWTKRNRICF